MMPAFRPATSSDLAALIALNDASVPHVNALTSEGWLRFLGGDARVRVAASTTGALDALTVTLPPGRAYGSENYAWFQRNLPDFVYVDRIVVAADRRGQGLGRAAYADIFAAVARDGPPVVCEVNLAPPNDTSLAFHGNLGFRELAVESVYGGSKRVAMLGRRCDGMAEPSLPGPRDGAVLRRAARGVAVAAEDANGAWVGGAEAVDGIAGQGVLVALEVAASHRGRGLGARLLAALRREGKTAGWSGLSVRADAQPAAARAFLLSNGFEARDDRLDLAFG
jgi:predicted GNAT superfamily acetyltransferase